MPSINVWRSGSSASCCASIAFWYSICVVNRRGPGFGSPERGVRMAVDGLVLTGEVRKVETLKGNKNGKDWVMILVYVLADVEVYECPVGRQWLGPIPKIGEKGSFLVSARAFLSGGSVRLGMDLNGRADQAQVAEAEEAPARALEPVG